MRYVMPLEDRQREAAWQRGRYRSDPTFRLDRINRVRARRGQPVLQSLCEAKVRLPIGDAR